MGPAMLDQLLPKANVVFFPLAGSHPLSAWMVPRCINGIRGRTRREGETFLQETKPYICMQLGFSRAPTSPLYSLFACLAFQSPPESADCDHANARILCALRLTAFRVARLACPILLPRHRVFFLHAPSPRCQGRPWRWTPSGGPSASPSPSSSSASAPSGSAPRQPSPSPPFPPLPPTPLPPTTTPPPPGGDHPLVPSHEGPPRPHPPTPCHATPKHNNVSGPHWKTLSLPSLRGAADPASYPCDPFTLVPQIPREWRTNGGCGFAATRYDLNEQDPPRRRCHLFPRPLPT